MRANQAVGAGAADEKRAAQHPEFARSHGPQQRPHRLSRNVVRRWRQSFSSAIRKQTNVRRLVCAAATSTTRNTTPAVAATVYVTLRQPCAVTSRASTGRKTSCPVALAAESMPSTRPRRASNQRLTTIAASTMAVTPVPVPTSTPQKSVSCHCECMVEESATPAVSTARASSTMRRSPYRSINDAANGPISPNSAILIAMAPEIAARLQPNSRSKGTIRMAGVARMPAVESRHQERYAGNDPGVMQFVACALQPSIFILC